VRFTTALSASGALGKHQIPSVLPANPSSPETYCPLDGLPRGAPDLLGGVRLLDEVEAVVVLRARPTIPLCVGVMFRADSSPLRSTAS
jgi:hypothetical protein